MNPTKNTAVLEVLHQLINTNPTIQILRVTPETHRAFYDYLCAYHLQKPPHYADLKESMTFLGRKFEVVEEHKTDI